MLHRPSVVLFFFFNDTATTEIYTLSLHDALPICALHAPTSPANGGHEERSSRSTKCCTLPRSEEHTSELQSQSNLVCRLLLEKKKKIVHPTPRDQPEPGIRAQSAHLVPPTLQVYH